MDLGCDLSAEEGAFVLKNLDDGDGKVNIDKFLKGLRGTLNPAR